MKAQAIFNKVYKHLMSQERPCMVDGSCVYRNKETGEKCAVGAILPDRLYREKYDKESFTALGIMEDPKVSAYFGEENRVLIHRLQTIHDNRWKNRASELKKLAKEYDLKIPSLK